MTVLAPDEIAEVRAGPVLRERILVNILLGNAVQPSPPDEPPTITVSEHAGTVEVRVIDRGPGIRQADWDRVFLPFQRMGDRDNETGAGLGVALSRGLAEAMGGTLRPEGTPGGGLTMTLSLPAVEAPTTRPGPDQFADPALLDRIDDPRSLRTGSRIADRPAVVADNPPGADA